MRELFEAWEHWAMSGSDVASFLKFIGSLVAFCIAVGAPISLVWNHYDDLAQVRVGTIAELTHRKAYTTTTVMMVGKTPVPQTIFHPERWGVVVEGLRNDGSRGQYEWRIERETWARLKVGDTYRSETQ